MQKAKAKNESLETSVVVDVRKGDKNLIGVCERLGVITEGRDVDELRRNLREAIDLSLEDGENLEYGICEKPEIVLNMNKNE